MIKADKPCGHYSGNMCSGFGGSLTCHTCGWEMYEHPSESLGFDLIYKPRHLKD